MIDLLRSCSLNNWNNSFNWICIKYLLKWCSSLTSTVKYTFMSLFFMCSLYQLSIFHICVDRPTSSWELIRGPVGHISVLSHPLALLQCLTFEEARCQLWSLPLWPAIHIFNPLAASMILGSNNSQSLSISALKAISISEATMSGGGQLILLFSEQGNLFPAFCTCFFVLRQGTLLWNFVGIVWWQIHPILGQSSKHTHSPLLVFLTKCLLGLQFAAWNRFVFLVSGVISSLGKRL
jgi:hypothetical protein